MTDRQSDKQTGRWKNIPLAITAFWRAYSAQSEVLWELVSNVVCQLHPIPSESKFPGESICNPSLRNMDLQ